MLNKELREKLNEMEKHLNELYNEDENLDIQIEDLKFEQEAVETAIEETEEDLEALRKKVQANEFDEIKNGSLDQFTKDFIIASYFCSSEDGRDYLQHVSIKINEIIAMDGYKAIIIHNDNIPEELKNSMIPWNIRESYEEEKTCDTNPVNVKNAFTEALHEAKEFYIGVTVENFKDKLNVSEIQKKEYSKPLYKMVTKKANIYVNQEYLKTALKALEGEIFNVHVASPAKPILMRNERIEVLVLPVRMLPDREF